MDCARTEERSGRGGSGASNAGKKWQIYFRRPASQVLTPRRSGWQWLVLAIGQSRVDDDGVADFALIDVRQSAGHHQVASALLTDFGLQAKFDLYFRSVWRVHRSTFGYAASYACCERGRGRFNYSTLPSLVSEFFRTVHRALSDLSNNICTLWPTWFQNLRNAVDGLPYKRPIWWECRHYCTRIFIQTGSHNSQALCN